MNSSIARDLELSGGVTLVVTSCGRLAHLLETIKTFAKHNTYPLSEAIFVEDGGLDLDGDLLSKTLNLNSSNVKILKNEFNIGQLASIDRAYELVNTEYIFHCEDDWEFIFPGFIETSIDILSADTSIFCVWLRGHNDTNAHPIEGKKFVTNSGTAYYLMQKDFKKIWSGFTLNPGLRRTRDCRLLYPYAKQRIQQTLGQRVRVTESDLSILYGELGFRGAISNNKSGFVRHTGYGYHLPSEWELSIWVKIKNFVRRLKLL